MFSFWRKRARESLPFSGKIEVFARHCISSAISRHKSRFPHFSREACYRNLLQTADFERVNLTCLLDVANGSKQDHFLRTEERHPVIEIQEGSEAGSFLRLLDIVSERHFTPETILYFVEDDYLHRPGWVDILLEGFQIPGVDYVTLYDHRDKYTAPAYQKLKAQLFATPSCHWRTTPSTTQTFATRWKTLQRDFSIHQRYSRGHPISRDHEKFCHLQKRGALLISSLPGWSTHAEPPFASPCIAWEGFLSG